MVPYLSFSRTCFLALPCKLFFFLFIHSVLKSQRQLESALTNFVNKSKEKYQVFVNHNNIMLKYYFEIIGHKFLQNPKIQIWSVTIVYLSNKSLNTPELYFKNTNVYQSNPLCFEATPKEMTETKTCQDTNFNLFWGKT